MRIAVAIPEMGTGGAEAVAAMLARHHLEAGHAVTFFTAGGWRLPELQQSGVDVVHVPLRGRRPWDLAVAVTRMRRAGLRGYDLVHAHNAKAAVAARAALAGSGRPTLLVTAHGFLAPDRARASALLARTADHVVAVSDETAERLREHGLPSGRVSVVENAVEPPARRDRREARRRLDLPEESPVALCLARMTVQKRHDLMLEAWRDWADRPLLLVAGDGPTRSEVERLVAAHGLGASVRLLGDRQDADWLFAASDLMVLPSDMEGLPVSVLEAMALEVPVVASGVGGLVALGPDVVTLAPPGESAGLREGAQRLLADDAYRRRQTEAGLRLVVERYGPEHMNSAYDLTYATISEQKGART